MSQRHAPILLVEDNPDDIELARRALAKCGVAHPIVVAEEGDRALALLRGGLPAPALVLLDLNLPGVSGRELLRQLRAGQRWATTPIVVLSTSTQPTDVDDCYRNGANSYHVKPADFHRYEQTVRAIAEYWLKTVVPPPSSTAVNCGERCYV